MSFYAWERGEIKLPSDQATDFKKRIRDAHNKRVDAIRDHCKRFWQDFAKRTQDRNIYEARAEEYTRTRCPVDLAPDVFHVLRRIAWTTKHEGKALRQVQLADLERVGLSKATNRTTTIFLGEASIGFRSGNIVVWDVPENNHAPDHARAHPVAEEFFRLLSRVRWTSRSGGKILGNDEYNRESAHDYEGGGGSYVVDTFGKDSPKRSRNQAWSIR